MKREWLVTFITALAVLATTASAGAQSAQEKQREIVITPGAVVVGGEAGAAAPMIAATVQAGSGGDTFVYVSTEMSFDGKLVKGAPYSAQAVTETVQILSDGNRIVNRSSSAFYRDSEGRTRREMTLRAIGSIPVSGEAPQTIFINDPVSGVSYVLNAREHTARKMPGVARIMNFGGNREFNDGFKAGQRYSVTTAERATVIANGSAKKEDGKKEGATTIVTPVMPTMVGPGPRIQGARLPENAKKESLGKQVIEGVEAEGTRLTYTIPAGEIGNEQPINIVSETWYSPELQVVVMSKHSDPRFGETTYKLTNINRSEPARSLFEVPSDFTIQEVNDGIRYKVEQELQRSKKNQM